MLISTGCAKTLGEKLDEASSTIGTTNARVTLPEYPRSCSKEYELTPLAKGGEARTALKRSDDIILAGNRDKRNCTAWYGKLSKGLAGGEIPIVVVPPP